MNQTVSNSTVESSSSIFNYGKWREGFLQAILIGAGIFGFIALTANFISGASPSDLITYSTAFAILLLAILIPFPYWFKALVFLILEYALAISGFLDTGLWGDSRVFLLALVVTACLLFSPLAGIITTILGTLTTILFGSLILTAQYQLTNANMPPGSLADWLTGVLTNILLSVVVIIGVRLVQGEFDRAREQAGAVLQRIQEESKNLESRVEERTSQLSQKSEFLRSAIFIARSLAELQNVPTLLEKTAQLTADLFGFYHVAIYLFDKERKVAFLQAASSVVGNKMMEKGFQIESNPRNVTGYVSEQGKFYLGVDPQDDKTRLISEGKLETSHSELAMPLNARGKLLGIIDFQSKESRTFNDDEMEILQSLADQIAISIDSAHLISDTQAYVSELQSLTSKQTRGVWEQHLKNRTLIYQYTPSGTKSIDPSVNKGNPKEGMQIPLRLRGQEIGQLVLQSQQAVKWTDRERDVAEKIATQVALALDNSRLLEETRQRAIQQQTVNEISARLSRSLDIDTLLRTAARELGTLPDVVEASVVVGEAKASEGSDGHH